MNTADFERELRLMRDRYREGSADRLVEIHQLASLWLHRQEAADGQRLIRALRRLAGSAGTFGFSGMTQAARATEAEVRRVVGTLADPRQPAVRRALADLTAAVEAELRSPDAIGAPSGEVGGESPDRFGAPAGGPLGRSLPFRRRDRRPVVGFFGPATEARFGFALREAGFRTELDAGPQDPALAFAVVGTQGELQTAPESRAAPRIALLSSEAFEDRLAAARVRAQTVLVEPVDDETLVEALEELRGGQTQRPPRLVVVDADADVAQELARILELEGMEARWVSHARDVLPVVREHRPDVLLTDLRMPDCTGFELASVVRQDPSMISLPVVFMSADDRVGHRALTQQDGDAFVSKSETLDVFVELVRSKARRARRLETSMTTDGMTGLLRHAVFKERLQNEVARCRRQGDGLACAMLDVDHFKQINDRYGHATGDRVIQGLSRLLRRRFRATDLLGRYGGEEFAVALVQTSAERARTSIDDLRRRFERLVFSGPGGSLRATFSAGIATYPEHETRDELLVAADEALYVAKQAGRNRVELHPSAPWPARDDEPRARLG